MEINYKNQTEIKDATWSLENIVKNIIKDKIKNVREDILLGEIKFKNKLPADSYLKRINLSHDQAFNVLNDEISSNGVIINNILKSFKIRLSNIKRKYLEHKLNLIDSKVTSLNNQIFNKIERGPKLFSSKLIISSLDLTKRNPRSLKMSERKQREIDAKVFIKKLNNDKYERLVKEDNKRRIFENKLLGIITNASNQIISKKIIINKSNNIRDKTIITTPNITNKILSNDISSVKQTTKNPISIKLPIFNNNITNVPTAHNDVTIRDKLKNISIRPEESINYLINENSISFKSVKKSPYYFNDPKIAKLMDIKQKYKYKKSNLNSDINYYSDGGGNSLDEYEIL